MPRLNSEELDQSVEFHLKTWEQNKGIGPIGPLLSQKKEVDKSKKKAPSVLKRLLSFKSKV